MAGKRFCAAQEYFYRQPCFLENKNYIIGKSARAEEFPGPSKSWRLQPGGCRLEHLLFSFMPWTSEGDATVKAGDGLSARKEGDHEKTLGFSDIGYIRDVHVLHLCNARYGG
jgi:hypothetical protein